MGSYVCTMLRTIQPNGTQTCSTVARVEPTQLNAATQNKVFAHAAVVQVYLLKIAKAKIGVYYSSYEKMKWAVVTCSLSDAGPVTPKSN